MRTAASGQDPAFRGSRFSGNRSQRHARSGRSNERDRSVVIAGSTVTFAVAQDKADRLTDDGTAYTFLYDPFGRRRKTVSKVSGTPVVEEYRHDALGRLVAQRYDTDSPAASISSLP